MKDFDKNLSIENLLSDPSFRAWVMKPNRELEERWTNWLQDNPKERDNVLMAREIVISVEDIEDAETNSSLKIRAWERIEKSITKIDCEQKHKPESKPKVLPIHPYYQHVSGFGNKRNSRKWFAIAATLLLVCISAFLISENFNLFEKEPVAEEATMIFKSNRAGQKSTIFLPDGSTAILNAESELSYKENFDGSSREVFLKGEAFFDVVKNTEKPFKVNSGNIATTALGTAFNIQYFNDSSSIEVSLVNGKVVVTDIEENKAIGFLEPGEQLQYDKSRKSAKKLQFIPQEVISWKDGVLYFKNADKQEVFQRLERWYGVKFIFTGIDAGKKWNYSGEYSNENLEVVLNGLGFTQGFSFKIKEKEVEIIYK